jgi:hypothetical protein
VPGIGNIPIINSNGEHVARCCSRIVGLATTARAAEIKWSANKVLCILKVLEGTASKIEYEKNNRSYMASHFILPFLNPRSKDSILPFIVSRSGRGRIFPGEYRGFCWGSSAATWDSNRGACVDLRGDKNMRSTYRTHFPF